ncbi:MAG: MBOAT family protein, partial [Bacteroidales bacterium]|nr:MBOAT family protein [Bacteroidales bacterium]
SLTTWFRDYVYIPLGGSRCSKAKVIRNTFVIFLLSGFWHGANWTFIAWGAYHAVLFLPLILLGKNRKHTDIVAAGRILPTFKEAGQMLLTFFLAVIGWIIFRAESIGQAWEYVCGMMQFETLKALYRFFLPNNLLVWSTNLYIIFMVMIEWIQRKEEHGLLIKKSSCTWLRIMLYYILIALIIYNCGEEQTFIYFQF